MVGCSSTRRSRSLSRRFRRIRYGNQLTETRTAYGTELDGFDALRVKVRGWGIDAVVSNFDDVHSSGCSKPTASRTRPTTALSLEEIFIAVAREAREERYEDAGRARSAGDPRERRMILAAAVPAAFLPFLVPVARGLHGAVVAREARETIAACDRRLRHRSVVAPRLVRALARSRGAAPRLLLLTSDSRRPLCGRASSARPGSSLSRRLPSSGCPRWRRAAEPRVLADLPRAWRLGASRRLGAPRRPGRTPSRSRCGRARRFS